MNAKVIFILGAGASRDFGYPLGLELKREILDRIKPKTVLRGNFLSAGRSLDDVEGFLRKLYCADHSTVDEFLGSQKARTDIREIGKEAIALLIAEFEDEKNLFNTGNWHWYKRLVTFLRANPHLAHRDSISFFTFNYDRSLEHYFHESMLSGGEFSESLEKDFFEKNFFHFHGDVGLLPWQNREGGSAVRSYGEVLSSTNLNLVARNILLPDEDLRIERDFLHGLANARVVVFLGFGFHQQNLKKLHFDTWSGRAGLKIMATMQGLEEEKRKKLRQLGTVELFDIDSTNLVAELIRRLEAGQL